MDTVSALTFRQKFGEILDMVNKSGSPLVIERQNQPIAVLYPYKEKRDEIQAEERKARFQKAEKMIADWRKKWGSGGKAFGGMTSTEFIRKMRDERYGKKWWKTRTHYWD
jgi:prevent-host-death family protein